MSGTSTKNKVIELPPLRLEPLEKADKKSLETLEHELAQYVGTSNCAMTSSGTAGLLLALRAAGVRDGDGVMCTAFSFFATAEIIALAGASPVLVDTNPNTFNIDPYCLEYVLKKCNRTKKPLPKALIAADLFGLPCDYDAILEICGRYNVDVIEDMSCAFGASYHEKKTGSFGRFSVASFFPARPLGGSYDGGGVFCRNREDYKLLESLRGESAGQQPPDFVHAKLISERLAAYDGELARRQLVAARYRDNFTGFVKVQQIPENCVSAYTQFVIALEGPQQRDAVIDALHDNKIPCSIPSCMQRERQPENEWERVVLTNTKQASERLLAIPMHPYLSVNVVDYICEKIMETVENA